MLKKISDVNYVIATPDRRKKEKMCHVNLIKRYNRREALFTTVVNVSEVTTEQGCELELPGV